MPPPPAARIQRADEYPFWCPGQNSAAAGAPGRESASARIHLPSPEKRPGKKQERAPVSRSVCQGATGHVSAHVRG